MEWWHTLIMLILGLLVLFALGLPVAFSFIVINLVGAYTLWGGMVGLEQLIFSMFDSVSTFILLPVPLFVLMGEIMLHSGIGFNILDALDKWMGRVPGRLSLLGVGGGTMLSTLSGSSIATAAILCTLLLPEMERRGYKKSMTVGPLIGSGGLAMIIPPSAMAVIVGSIAEISIGQLLIAGVVPGLLIALMYFSYIVLRCWINPSIAPAYIVTGTPLSEKIYFTLKYVLPLGFIIFLVIGLILLGVVTPTEAAAIGCLGTVILAAVYKRLNWEIFRKSIFGTLHVAVMMFMIITGSIAFSQILAFSGATRGLIEFTMGLNLPPMALVVSMQGIMLILGCFMDPVSVLMITVPIYMPLVNALELSLVWIGIIMLINMEVATETPPFGLLLFVTKGVAPPDTTMGDIYRSVLPFVIIDILAMVLVLIFPQLALWLPGLMFKPG
ncbi:MAG: TRAP transporter large permease subunit [Pseudomonadota bacterium]